jgi:transcription elongation factor GreA
MISLMSSCNTVAIGSTTEIRDLHSNEREVYTLTHPRDADITYNKISSLTPLAVALHGRRIGDIVEVDAPGGKFRVRIESVDDEAVDQYARAG